MKKIVIALVMLLSLSLFSGCDEDTFEGARREAHNYTMGSRKTF